MQLEQQVWSVKGPVEEKVQAKPLQFCFLFEYCFDFHKQAELFSLDFAFPCFTPSSTTTPVTLYCLICACLASSQERPCLKGHIWPSINAQQVMLALKKIKKSRTLSWSEQVKFEWREDYFIERGGRMYVVKGGNGSRSVHKEY